MKSIPPVLPVQRNRALIRGFIILVSAGILFVAISTINHVRLRAQKLETENDVKHLGILLEIFSGDHGDQFPSSLQDPELVADSDTMSKIAPILHERFRDNFEYQRIGHGFRIKVHGEEYEYHGKTN